MRKLSTILFMTLFTIGLFARDNRGGMVFKNVSVQQKDWLYEVQFDMEVNSNSVGKKESLFLVPQLVSGQNVLSLPYLQLNGKNRCKSLKRARTFQNEYASLNGEPPYVEEEVTKNTRKTITYTVEVPYEEWMDDAVFTVKEELHSCARMQHAYAYELINPDVMVPEANAAPVRQTASAQTKTRQTTARQAATRQPVKQTVRKKETIVIDGIKPRVSYVMPELSQKKREETSQAFLDFPQGQSTIVPSFRNNAAELAKIRATVDKIQNDPSLEVKSITLTGYASPEGNYQTNQQLAFERANAQRSYLSRYSRLSNRIFDVLPGGEDWKTLREMIEDQNAPMSDQVLAIIDSWDDFDRKEQRLKSLGMTYDMLVSDYFPALRRVDYTIEYVVKDFNLAESRDMLTSNPGHLSPYEMYRIANNYEKESDKWNEIIELTVNLHPDDKVANINAAGVLLNKGDLVAAKICLDKVQDLPGAWNNLGVYYLYRGDLVKATEYFAKAMFMGVEESHYNMEIQREMELYILD